MESLEKKNWVEFCPFKSFGRWWKWVFSSERMKQKKRNTCVAADKKEDSFEKAFELPFCRQLWDNGFLRRLKDFEQLGVFLATFHVPVKYMALTFFLFVQGRRFTTFEPLKKEAFHVASKVWTAALVWIMDSRYMGASKDHRNNGCFLFTPTRWISNDPEKKKRRKTCHLLSRFFGWELLKRIICSKIIPQKSNIATNNGHI